MSSARVTLDGAQPSQSVDLAVGQVLGRYRVDAILGRGGMGTVARARDLDLDRDVALKVASAAADPARDRQRSEWLLREAQAMARLRMRNVRAVHDVGSANGVDYVAMEYIAGIDLATWLETSRSTAQIIDVFMAAGRGLAAAHAAEIIHGDVKPSNILVGDDGEIVVTDFGLARWMHEPALAGGTPGYLAPDPTQDARSDQYSFCVALAQALPATARAARAVARRGSRPAPEARYPSMAAVVVALERTRRRRRASIAVLALAASAVIALVAAWSTHGERATTDDAELARVHALTEHGFVTSARRALAAILERAVPSEHARVHYELGLAALFQDDVATARKALDEAVQLADASKDDGTRAKAEVALFMLAASRSSDLPALARAEGVAAAAAARVDLDKTSQARLHYAEALAALARDDRPAAVRMLAEARQVVTPPDDDALVTWCEIVRTQAGVMESDAERIALDRELVATADRVGGRAHMTAISARGDLATALEQAGLLDEAAVVMAELRAAGRTAAGQRLLNELDATPHAALHPVSVTVLDPVGAPVASATVVAATGFSSNARDLLAADSLYAEHARATTVVATDSSGRATVDVPVDQKMWFAAEHPSLGRAFAVSSGAEAPVTLVLAPWGQLSGTAAGHVFLVPDSEPSAPRLEARTIGDTFAFDRLASGRYFAATCSRAEADADATTCAVERVVVSTTTASVALALPRGSAELVVHVHDELTRPIESSTVILVPPDFTPASKPEFDRDWLAAIARRPGSFVASTDVHATQPARFANLPAGHYALCVAAIHGDTEDPSFTARLVARTAPIPLFCKPVTVATGVTDVELAVPAASRVWLGDPK